jgi:hypothetical protein
MRLYCAQAGLGSSGFMEPGTPNLQHAGGCPPWAPCLLPESSQERRNDTGGRYYAAQ